MKRYFIPLLCLLLFSCKHSSQTEDELYSRHLQRKVKLTILHTPAPADRSLFNLLILNNGEDLKKMRVKEIMDSLYKSEKLEPLVVIGVQAGDTAKEYGIAGKPDYLGRGDRASFYDDFINNELYPYAKKQTGVRKFNSVAIAGWGLGGLSAFDIAWNHPDKISRVGVFSGLPGWRDKAIEDSSYTDEHDRILFSKLKASRKKPGLQYWFCAETAERKSNRDSLIETTNDTKDLMALLLKKNAVSADGIMYREIKGGTHDCTSWSTVFPGFLEWAFGK